MKKQLLIFVIPIMLLPGLVMSQTNSTLSVDTLNDRLRTLNEDIAPIKRIKLSGYIQAQYQLADSGGQSSFAGGNFAPGVDNRFMIRRGRLKVTYTAPDNAKGISISQYIFQIDATEKAVAIRDLYAKITDPWTGSVSLTMGMFNNPFGFDISYSSGLRESPERGRMSQLHFPNEREIGAMITISGPKGSKWSWLKLDAGFFNGNGSPVGVPDVSDFDSKKDFITRFSFDRSAKSDKIKYSGGLSYYDGGFRIDSVADYKSGIDANSTTGFILQNTATENGSVAISNRRTTTRKYVGVDAQISYSWNAGTTILRGEYITGDQPGNSTSTRSPNDKNPVTRDVFTRKFNGAYFYFVQNIMKSPFQVVVKYDWYDPNTDAKGDEIGKSMIGSEKATNSTDVRYDTWGLGLNYQFDTNIKITAYYDFVKNEISENLSGYTQDRKDNVLTLRLQVRY